MELETAKFSVVIRANGMIVRSSVETIAWDLLDLYEEEMKAANPGCKVEIIEYEY